MHQPGQQMYALDSGRPRVLDLPHPDKEAVPGVSWGAYDTLFTPAFWKGRAWLDAPSRRYEQYRLGETLQEELAACLLGGHGIAAETGLAAYHRVRRAGLLAGRPTAAVLFACLSEPVQVDGRQRRYRFARKKSEYLAACLERLPEAHDLPRDDKELRNLLVRLPGIGLKTASWITRNWRGSDDVAILDIHICRACEAAGVFEPGSNPARDYLDLEGRFLNFAAAIDTPPSILDNLMWQMMRRIGRLRSTTIPVRRAIPGPSHPG